MMSNYFSILNDISTGRQCYHMILTQLVTRAKIKMLIKHKMFTEMALTDAEIANGGKHGK